MAVEREDIQYVFEGTVDSLRKATDKAIDLLDKYEAKVNKVSIFNPFKSLANSSKNALGNVTKIVSVLGGSVFSKALEGSIKQSISLVENVNLFTVAMGKSVDEATKFVNKMSELYGMDVNNLYRTAGYFYQLSDAIGMTDEASKQMSLSLTKASNDIASLFNVDVQTVVNNLASGMQGLSRAVRKYGMDIRTTTLQQTALTYGITTNVQKMSEANRMALRYITMMNQANNAIRQTTKSVDGASTVMGDFARNIETPANQLRIFKEQCTQVGRAIGAFFIPALSKLLPILNGFAMALKTILEFIAGLFKINVLDFGGATTSAEEEADAIKGIGDAATSTANKLKKLIAPFDELTVLQEKSSASGSGGGGMEVEGLDPALAKAIEDMQLQLDEISMKAHKVRDALLEFFGFEWTTELNLETGEFEEKLKWLPEKFEKNLINKFPQWEKTIRALFDNWTKIIEGFKKVAESLKHVFEEIWKVLTERVNKALGGLSIDEAFAKFIEELPNKLNAISQWLEDNKGAIAGIFGGLFDILVAILNVVGQIVEDIAGVNFSESFTQFINDLPGKLEAIASYLNENKEQIAKIVETLAAAWAILSVVAGLGLASKLTKLLKVIVGISEMLAPLLSQIGSIIAANAGLVAIIVAVIAVLVTLWHKSDEFRDAVKEAVQNIMDIINKLWTDVAKPVLDDIVDLVKTVWKEIKPVIDKVIDIIGEVMVFILKLYNGAFAPIVKFLIGTLGPAFSSVFHTVIDVVKYAVEFVSRLIDSLLQILKGLIQFISGVFTGDWKKAWEGVKNVFGGVINGLITIVEGMLNFLITALNSFIGVVINGISSVLRGIINFAKPVLDAAGITINLKAFENVNLIPRLNIPRVQFAEGGVVTGPTNALIGEGNYDEAVIPLGNSPQMRELVGDIANAVGGDKQVQLLQEQNELLRQILSKTGTVIDGRSLAEGISKYQKQRSMAYGV